MKDKGKSDPCGYSKDTNPRATEEVLQENGFPMKARRIQNFVKNGTNNEALVEIKETDEPSITLPPRQHISD